MTANSDIRLSGQNGAIYIGGAAGGAGVRAAAKSQWTFANTRDFYDLSAFGDTNKRWAGGLRDAQGTYAGIYDASGDRLFAAAALGPQLLYLYADDNTQPTSVALYLVANGSGFLDGTVDCNLNDAIKVSGNFRAAANWTIFDGS